MKLTGLALAAATLAASLTFAAPVEAQMARHVEVHRTTTTVVRDGPRWKHKRHRVCSTRWVHHKRVRHCYWR